MKINKLNPEFSRLFTTSNQVEERQSSTPNSRQILINGVAASKHQLPPAFNKLDKNLQRLLLKTWLALELPLNNKYISQLIKLINNHSSSLPTDKLIKAFTFLLKNNLPLLPQLIDGIAANLARESSLSKKINNLLLSNKEITELLTFTKKNDKKQIAELFKRLSIKLDNSPEKLSQQLSEYHKETGSLIRLLAGNGDQAIQKLVFQLLGQQLLNYKESKQETEPLLMALELPLNIPGHDKLLPFYLQIKKNRPHQQQEKKEKNDFTISLFINLEKLGLLSADLAINTDLQQIETTFYTSSADITRLLNDKFPLLQDRLDKLGYKTAHPVIRQLNADDQHFDPAPPLFSEKENIGLSLKHIDILV